MVRGWAVVLGIGLIILGLAGLDPAAGQSWIGWLDFVGAFFSFVIAGAVSPNVTTNASARTATTSGPVAMAIALFAMAIIGLLSRNVAGWLCWWNIGFACAYMVVGVAASATSERMTVPSRPRPAIPESEAMTSRVERERERQRHQHRAA